MESIHGSINGAVNRDRALFALKEAEALFQEEELRRILEQPPMNDTPLPRQVFVNRNLNLSKVDLIGFDMDYTLAIYHLRRLELLSYDMTVQRLITAHGYPDDVATVPYDQQFVQRGLFVDKVNGNLLKLDRFGQVGRAYHGKRALTGAEVDGLYHNERIRLKNPEYAWIDTLFALPEACLLSGIVDLYENVLHREVDYRRLYDDIREAIDTVHRDNSLKRVIRSDMSRYVFKDPELGPALHRLRSGGKKLFVLTNSAWDYTDAVMSYLLDGMLPEYPSWRNYFDLVITSGMKPAFFGAGSPFLEVDTSSAENQVLGPATTLERGKVYAQGNLLDFERLSGARGARVLYIGDHIYGDILKSKKSSMWRTCMIVQEIEDEIAYLVSRREDLQRIGDLEQLQGRLEDEIAPRKTRLNQIEKRLEKAALTHDEATLLEAEFKAVKHDLDRLRRSRKQASELAKVLEADVEHGFNPFWGLHFKEGAENSRFGDQVEQYACLYTSRVSNFGFYSPVHYFRSPREFMPHETGTLRFKLLGAEGLPKGTQNEGDIL